MDQLTLFIIVGAAVLVLLIVGFLVMIARFYRIVEQGKALIVNKTGGQEVTFTGATVLPIINRAEVMDISVKTIEIDRKGKEGLICKDNIRADIKVTFFVRVNKTQEDVLKVAQSIGCVRASDQQTLEELFTAKFSEALKSVGKGLEFEELYTRREKFRDDIINVIGKDLNGYALEDAAIDYLEQTPLEMLDPENILDADGIRKIREITTKQNVATNELIQIEKMELGKQNTNSNEAIKRYEREQAEVAAKTAKEIEIAQSREQNEAARVKIDEQLKTKKAQEKAMEEAQIAEQNRQRAVMVAEQARLRELGQEQVRVQRARDVEDIGRKREVQVKDIEREEEIEQKKKKIADVIRDRIAVEKTVAQEEELIKDLRANAEAKRHKDVVIIGAEAQAQEVLVKEIKKAEADEEVAKHRARQRLTLADAELEAADRDARAKMRLSEGIQAESAAPGLAEVRVKEADAAAVEKQGLAKVRVRDAEVSVREREGMVEATIIREKELAAATGIEKRGLAEVSIKDANAAATEKMGLAEAVSIRERLLAEVTAKEAEAAAIQKRMFAEAEGIQKKGDAMKAMDGVGREHEEFRLNLNTRKEIALEELETRIAIAEKQAAILSKAFERANINIVGGDGAFFDKFINAVAVGKSIDGTVGNSSVLKNLLAEGLGNGNGNGDVAQALRQLAPGGSLSGVLDKLMSTATPEQQGKIKELIEHAKNVDD
jgi:uncharacterized membrane protein YqiK